MSFGLTNAPAKFQRIMQSIIGDIDHVTVYLDDILIATPDVDTNIEAIEKVFARLKANKIKVRIDKCEFLMRQVEFLGDTISDKGIGADKNYIRKFMQMNRPQNVKQLERVLGVVQWLSRHTRNLSVTTEPLNELRKKGAKWKWEPRHERAWQELRRKVCQPELLHHPDPDKKFIVRCDASDYAIGACLLQQVHGQELLIESCSKKLNKYERNYHTSEKELYAIVFALHKWYHHLMMRKFTVFTDHRNLVSLLNYAKNCACVT